MKLKLLLLTLFISGCITSSGIMRRVSLGMTKEEVIQKIGKPASVSAKDNVEYFNYSLAENLIVESGTPYFIRFVNGVVESYGRLGDFDSTKIPEQKISIDLKQTIEKER